MDTGLPLDLSDDLAFLDNLIQNDPAPPGAVDEDEWLDDLVRNSNTAFNELEDISSRENPVTSDNKVVKHQQQLYPQFSQTLENLPVPQHASVSSENFEVYNPSTLKTALVPDNLASCSDKKDDVETERELSVKAKYIKSRLLDLNSDLKSLHPCEQNRVLMSLNLYAKMLQRYTKLKSRQQDCFKSMKEINVTFEQRINSQNKEIENLKADKCLAELGRRHHLEMAKKCEDLSIELEAVKSHNFQLEALVKQMKLEKVKCAQAGKPAQAGKSTQPAQAGKPRQPARKGRPSKKKNLKETELQDMVLELGSLVKNKGVLKEKHKQFLSAIGGDTSSDDTDDDQESMLSPDGNTITSPCLLNYRTASPIATASPGSKPTKNKGNESTGEKAVKKVETSASQKNRTKIINCPTAKPKGASATESGGQSTGLGIISTRVLLKRPLACQNEGQNVSEEMVQKKKKKNDIQPAVSVEIVNLTSGEDNSEQNLPNSSNSHFDTAKINITEGDCEIEDTRPKQYEAINPLEIQCLTPNLDVLLHQFCGQHLPPVLSPLSDSSLEVSEAGEEDEGDVSSSSEISPSKNTAISDAKTKDLRLASLFGSSEEDTMEINISSKDKVTPNTAVSKRTVSEKSHVELEKTLDVVNIAHDLVLSEISDDDIQSESHNEKIPIPPKQVMINTRNPSAMKTSTMNQPDKFPIRSKPFAGSKKMACIKKINKNKIRPAFKVDRAFCKLATASYHQNKPEVSDMCSTQACAPVDIVHVEEPASKTENIVSCHHKNQVSENFAIDQSANKTATVSSHHKNQVSENFAIDQSANKTATVSSHHKNQVSENFAIDQSANKTATVSSHHKSQVSENVAIDQSANKTTTVSCHHKNQVSENVAIDQSANKTATVSSHHKSQVSENFEIDQSANKTTTVSCHHKNQVSENVAIDQSANKTATVSSHHKNQVSENFAIDQSANKTATVSSHHKNQVSENFAIDQSANKTATVSSHHKNQVSENVAIDQSANKTATVSSHHKNQVSENFEIDQSANKTATVSSHHKNQVSENFAIDQSANKTATVSSHHKSQVSENFEIDQSANKTTTVSCHHKNQVSENVAIDQSEAESQFFDDTNKDKLSMKIGQIIENLKFARVKPQRTIFTTGTMNKIIKTIKSLVDSPNAMELMKTDASMTKMSEALVAEGLVYNVLKMQDTILNKDYTPPAPPLTLTEQRTLAAIAAISKIEKYSSLAESVAKLICTILNEQHGVVQQQSSKYIVARLLVGICRSKGDLQTVRVAMYDALCTLPIHGCGVVHTMLSAWPEILPVLGSLKYPTYQELPILVDCIVYSLLSFTAANDRTEAYHALQLKDIIDKCFGYKQGVRTATDVVTSAVQKLKGGGAGSGGFESGLLLLSMTENPEWIRRTLVGKILLPLLLEYQSPGGIVAQSAVRVISQLVRQMDCQDPYVEQVIKHFVKMLLDEVHLESLQEPLACSLMVMCRARSHVKLLRDTLNQWNPKKNLSDKFYSHLTNWLTVNRANLS